MARLLLGLALVVGPVASLRAEVEHWRFEIDGQPRVVRVHVPDGASPSPRRMVVIFHGLGDRDDLFADSVRFHKDWPDAIVAYPNGEIRPDRESKRGWQVRAGQYDDRDLKLVDRLLAEATARHDVRPEHTHAAGFSNGGHFVFLLMAERPEAFATYNVIGSVHPKFASDAPPKPVLYLFGRGEGRQYKDDWTKTVEAMVRHNRTRGPLAEWMGCCHRQSPGPGGAPLVFGIYNAGHIWPHQGNEWLRAFIEREE